MKKFYKLLLHFGIVTLTSLSSYAQCGNSFDIVICDMNTIDYDNDGMPDGIINLFDEYEKIRQPSDPILDTTGIWNIEDTLSIPLNESTGEVSLWEYQFSSATNQGSYVFMLTTTSCGNRPSVTLNIELGSFSGVALPPGPSGVNLEVCDRENVDRLIEIDLFESLTSDESTPSPHLNGEWQLINSPSNALNFELGTDGSFRVDIQYQEGLPLIDKGEFEFRYVVPATDNCAEQETSVIVSVVRQVDAGSLPQVNMLNICESAIIDGIYDNDIDLTDDIYLIGEDVEGFWTSVVTEDIGGISDVFDSEINIKAIYENLIATKGPRFGSERYTFNYEVTQRSGVCEDDNTDVDLIIYEELRPFNQSSDNASFCLEDTPRVNLFSLVEFTNENGIDFIYPNGDGGTSWQVVSTPGSQPITIGNQTPDNGVFFLTDPDGEFIETGTYVFQFNVDSSINTLPEHNASTCQSLSATITVEVLPFDYAGENNTELIELCETEESVILTDLLEIDDLKAPIITTGVWTDASGMVFDNNFIFPEIDADTQYNLTYNTTHPVSGCFDSSELSFTIINEKLPGSVGESITSDGIVKLCADDLNIILFDQLQNADPIGQWTGPANYVSEDHRGAFFFNDQTMDDLVEGEYTYTINNEEFCTSVETTTITIQFVTPIELADTVTQSYCQDVGSIDLLTLLEVSAPENGVFEDLDNTGTLTGSVFDFSTLTFNGIGEYNFRYTLDLTPCDTPSQNFVIQVLDGSQPPSAGISPTESVRVCANNLTINLFDQLGGSPSQSGIWSGPFTYQSNDHVGRFEQGNPNLPILGSGIYTYTVGGGICNAPLDTASIEIEIVQPIELGENVNASFCKLEGGVNLFSLLDEDTTAAGEFTDIDGSNSLGNDGFFDFSNLSSGIYNFQYAIPNEAPCDISSLNVEINVVEIPMITGAESEFCILNASNLEDIEVYYLSNVDALIEVDSNNINWYTSLQSDQPVTNNPKLIDGDVYYVAHVGLVNNEECESERFAVEVNILNVGEESLTGNIECPLEFQDGVSADGNNVNDTFSLNWKNEDYDIESAFPDFELEIYNRYGVKVYIGNSNTAEFDGNSNVSLSIGSDLPSGVYFYIFNPNFLNNSPIQGSFYLSK